MRVDWIPDVLRAAGLTVIETPGSHGRGHDLHVILGVVIHGTGSDAMSVPNTVNLLIEGRSPDKPKAPDHLPGPLVQLGLDHDGIYHFIADGLCNHNGYGEWGNQTIGIEMFGATNFTPVQLANCQLGTAAMLRHLVLPPSRAKGHKETDPHRKPDPIGVDMGGFRAAVSLDMDHLDRGTTPTHQEDIVRHYQVVTVPTPDAKGHQIVGLEHLKFADVTSVDIKANDDGTPVQAVAQPFAYADDCAVTLVGFDGKPLHPGAKIGLIITATA